MRQVEALEHVAHSGGSLYLHSGRHGMHLICREDSTIIGVPMVGRLMERKDLELVDNAWSGWPFAVLTDQGRGRL